MLEPRIEEKPELKVVGLEAAFISGLSPQTNAYKIIPPLWQQFSRRQDEVPNRIGREMYGVMYVRPQSQRDRPDEMQYISSVAVSSIAKIPEGMTARTIPAGTFAVFTHRGLIRKIAETCYQIYRVWLPQSKFEHAGIADVEMYDHRFDADNENSEMEYWISVKLKSTSK